MNPPRTPDSAYRHTALEVDPWNPSEAMANYAFRCAVDVAWRLGWKERDRAADEELERLMRQRWALPAKTTAKDEEDE